MTFIQKRVNKLKIMMSDEKKIENGVLRGFV